MLCKSLQIVQVQVITTGIFDNFPFIQQKGKTATRILVCVVGFIMGLMCVTQVKIHKFIQEFLEYSIE